MWKALCGALVIVALCAAVATVEKRAAAERRKAEYLSALAQYKQVLPIGESRVDAEDTLRSRGINFSLMCCIAQPKKAWADLVSIGQEPAPWYCNRSTVYIALEFAAAGPNGATEARASDRLERVLLYPRLEQCL